MLTLFQDVHISTNQAGFVLASGMARSCHQCRIRNIVVPDQPRWLRLPSALARCLADACRNVVVSRSS